MKQKHAELIKKWADGEDIECRMSNGKWIVVSNPAWSEDLEYREKPKEPEWMPNYGDLILVCDCLDDQMEAVIFEEYRPETEFPWEDNNGHQWVNAKPHAKQILIDRYREGIKEAIDALSWPDTLAVLFSLQKGG